MMKLLIWQAITPVHSGTGQSSAGNIDLPIAREVATHYPMIPASSIKGVLRDGDGLRKDEKDIITAGDRIYGYVNKKTGRKNESGEDERESSAGKLTFTDARLLCLPVRSYRGTFALLTCPLIIHRLERDMRALGLKVDASLSNFSQDITDGKAHAVGQTLVYRGKVLFEDIDMDMVDCPQAKALASTLTQWTNRADLKEHLAVVPNDVFAYFSETAMEVSARIALDPSTKTVKGTALWYEEALPAESVLSSFVLSDTTEFEPKSFIQVGGKGSIGKGLLSVREA